MRKSLFFVMALSALGISLGAQAPAPGTPRGLSPIDLTGNWVSIVTEDWRFRMVTPPKGDYASLPLNAAARAVADKWDPAKDVWSRDWGLGARDWENKNEGRRD